MKNGTRTSTHRYKILFNNEFSLPNAQISNIPKFKYI